MALYNEIEKTKDYGIYILADLEKLKLNIKKYNVSSLKWNMHHSVDTLEEAKEWVESVNSYEPISSETIYNSRVIYETTDLPNWLENKIGLHGYELENITQDKVIIKTHVSFEIDYKNYIEIYSVWFQHNPVIVTVEGNKDDIFIKIIDKNLYALMVEYLYQLKIKKVLAEEEATTNKDISLIWGYFTEDLLNKK